MTNQEYDARSSSSRPLIRWPPRDGNLRGGEAVSVKAHAGAPSTAYVQTERAAYGEPGETCIVIVGRTFDASILRALGVEMIVTSEEIK